MGVYNFVQHADRRTGETAGYIVMEYVGGQSLRQILLEHRRVTSESLPLPVALAYAIEVLPALGYLHNRGLVYCDFKPDNVIQTEEQLKLIDMGGVRRIDDPEGAIYGTEGYQAPEIADAGPSPASDLYTVGRSLAVMTFRFAGYQTEFKHRLPDPSAVPLLAEQESFYRALRRSTDPDPDRRFESASDMAEQLTGVLREVVAVADQQPRPAFSALFSPELRAIGVAATMLDGQAGAGAPHPAPPAAEIVAGLPIPQVDSGDPAAGYLATLSTLDSAQRITALSEAIAGGAGVPPGAADSAETRLALIRELIVTGDLAGAQRVLGDLAAIDPGDWRVAWYTGLRSLAADNPAGARAAFDAVYDALPGELAPKLGLAYRGRGRRGPRRGGPVLPARVDGRPLLRQRRVRAGQGPASGRRRAGRGRGAHRGPRCLQPSPGRAGGRGAHPDHGPARPDQGRGRRPAGGRRPDRAAQAGHRASGAAHRRGPAGRAGERRLRGDLVRRRAARLRAERALPAVRARAQLPGPGPAGA